MNSTRTRSTVWIVAGATLALVMSVLVTSTWRADAAPGTTDSTFVPITPCRLVDTRPAPLRVGPHGTFSAADTTTIPARGTNGQCVIPNDAVGLALNVTALNATVETYLTFWPDGPLPLAANLNPAPGQPPNPNSVVVSLDPTGSFRAYNNTGNVDVVIDVNGLYTKSSLNELHQRMLNSEARLDALELRRPRVAHAESGNINEAIFGGGGTANLLTVNLTAPAAGSLVITGQVDVFGNTLDRYRCDLVVDGTFIGGSANYGVTHYAGAGHTENNEGQCVTTLTRNVGAGSHTVSLRMMDRGAAQLDDASLWAIWLPA